MRLLIPMDFRPLATGLKQPISLVMERRIAMKAGIFFTGTGPILILTSYESLDDPKLVEKLAVKGIRKYIAYEVPPEKVKSNYGNHYAVVLGDLKQSDDLRVLDYDGHHVFYSFSIRELGEPVFHEA
jgi:hypothetical protein